MEEMVAAEGVPLVMLWGRQWVGLGLKEATGLIQSPAATHNIQHREEVEVPEHPPQTKMALPVVVIL
jgi:hypothetical protein